MAFAKMAVAKSVFNKYCLTKDENQKEKKMAGWKN